MISIIRYTFITAIRDLLFIGLLVLILIAIFISYFLGSTAIVEQNQMIISYMGGSSRLILIIGLVLFICFHVRRAMDNKEIEVILTKSLSRFDFVIAYWSGFALLSIIITFSLIVMIASLSIASNQGLIFWGLSLILESIIIGAFAMLAALIMKSAVTSALSTLCFYLMSRMMGFFIIAIDHIPTNFSFNNILNWSSEGVLRLVSMILPRLDLFGKTSWLVYGVDNYNEIYIFLFQSLVYIPFLLTIIIFDFKRKQF